MIHLLTAIGLTAGGSSTVHIYTQAMYRTTQWTQIIHRTTQFTNLFIREKFWIEPNLFPYKYPNIIKPSRSSHLPVYEDGTGRVFRNVSI